MRTPQWKVALSLSVLSALALAPAACVAPEDELEIEPVPEQPESEPWIAEIGSELQGKYLLGEDMDAIEGEDADHHFSVSRFAAPAIEVKFIGGAALELPTGSNQVTLPASSGDQLQITFSRGDTNVSYYHLSRFDSADQMWKDPCEGTEAVPFLGTFNRNGRHDADDGRLTFGCATGVALKCVDWGYRPGPDKDARNTWQAHQACGQMARADYCRTGTAHTREETAIQIYDFVPAAKPAPTQAFEGVDDWPPPPNNFYFEAAYLIGHQPAFCLSRIRWRSLPLGGPEDCLPGELPDPREDPDAHFCEDYDWDGDGSHSESEGHVPLPNRLQEPDKDILVLNASTYNDLPLEIWHKGTDQVTTVQGYPPNDEEVAELPWPNGNWQHAGPDGFLLRNLMSFRSGVDVHRARIYKKGTDTVLGPDATTLPGWLPNGYTPVASAPAEGWIFPPFPERAGTVELKLWQRTTPAGPLEYLSSVNTPQAGGYTESAASPIGRVFDPAAQP
jgi:ADYC domain